MYEERNEQIRREARARFAPLLAELNAIRPGAYSLIKGEGHYSKDSSIRMGDSKAHVLIYIDYAWGWNTINCAYIRIKSSEQWKVKCRGGWKLTTADLAKKIDARAFETLEATKSHLKHERDMDRERTKNENSAAALFGPGVDVQASYRDTSVHVSGKRFYAESQFDEWNIRIENVKATDVPKVLAFIKMLK